MPICRQCGDEVADERYITDGLCYSCQIDTWIPEGYEDRELYKYDTTWGHENATCRPATGIQFLDRHAPSTFEQWIYKVSLSDRELLIVRLLASGYSQEQAACRVGISQQRVSYIVRRIAKKG
jgi:DNA-binding CsgD family transcriptional regulator